MLNEIFETLGFKEEETRTYLNLLESGAIPAGELAKKMQMPRATTYGYLEKLFTGGLVSKSERQGTKIFVAEPGEKIRLLYKRKIEELRAKEKSLDNVISELQERSGMNLLRPRLQFFEGRDGMEAALEDILTASPGTMTYAFWPINAAIGATSEDFFRYHNMERIKRDIHIQAIWPQKQGVDIKRFPFMGWGEEYKREIRYAPEEIEFTMGYWIYGNKTVFTSSRAESYGYIVESAEQTQLMATQHKMIWKVSTPVPFDKKFAKPFLKELRDYIAGKEHY